MAHNFFYTSFIAGIILIVEITTRLPTCQVVHQQRVSFEILIAAAAVCTLCINNFIATLNIWTHRFSTALISQGTYEFTSLPETETRIFINLRVNSNSRSVCTINIHFHFNCWVEKRSKDVINRIDWWSKSVYCN